MKDRPVCGTCGIAFVRAWLPGFHRSGYVWRHRCANGNVYTRTTP